MATTLLRTKLAAASLQAPQSGARASTSALTLAAPIFSQCSHFHTTPANSEKRKKRVARLKKKTNLSRRHDAIETLNKTAPDPIRGYAKGNEQLWQECALKKLILDKEKVWKGGFTPTVGNAEGPDGLSTNESTPLNFGLSAADSHFLFEQLPSVSTYQTINASSTAVPPSASTLASRMAAVEPVERNKTELLKRILDLRNANSRGIRFENTKRIVEHFSNQSRRDANGKVKPDPGRVEVQAAILTMRIHNLADHFTNMPRDIHCKRGLRALVMARAKLLKYLKRYDLERYVKCLQDIGVEQRAVEGEIILRG